MVQSFTKRIKSRPSYDDLVKIIKESRETLLDDANTGKIVKIIFHNPLKEAELRVLKFETHAIMLKKYLERALFLLKTDSGTNAASFEAHKPENKAELILKATDCINFVEAFMKIDK